MNRVRAVVGVLGELLVTAGVVVLLFVVWQLGWSAVVDGRAQAAVAADAQSLFAAGGSSAQVPVLGPGEAPLPDTLFALVRIPRLGGSGHALPVYEGTSLATLAKGLGHYVGTALPGQIGNAAIAGHRMTHGNPLVDIDTIQPGDVVVVESRDRFDVYRVDRHLIVRPTDVSVIDPVPQQPGAAPTQALLTLTSCEPKFGSRDRYIVFAHLETTYSRAQGLPLGVLADPREG